MKNIVKIIGLLVAIQSSLALGANCQSVAENEAKFAAKGTLPPPPPYEDEAYGLTQAQRVMDSALLSESTNGSSSIEVWKFRVYARDLYNSTTSDWEVVGISNSEGCKILSVKAFSPRL